LKLQLTLGGFVDLELHDPSTAQSQTNFGCCRGDFSGFFSGKILLVGSKMFRHHPTFKFIQLHKKLTGEVDT
jgi:hypothetical protein